MRWTNQKRPCTRHDRNRQTLIIPGADLLLQLAVIHLAHRGQGHLADELVGYRLHILRQFLHTELPQLSQDLTLFVSGSRVQHHEHKGQAALGVVLGYAAHHRALPHGRVMADGVLDHGGEHLETVGTDDQPLDPGTHKHKAILVDIAHVPGVHPGAAVRVDLLDGGGLLRLVVVTLHDGLTADADLALFPDGQLLGGTGLKHRDDGVHQGDTGTAGLGDGGGSGGGGRGALCEQGDEMQL